MTKPLTRAEIEQQAGRTLVEHGLYSIPVDPVVLANKLGIRVYNAKFSDESLAAMICRRGPNVTILLEESDQPYRKRFSIAHELAHHFLHLSADGEIVDHATDLFRDTEVGGETLTEERLREIEANRFAAALLMPAQLVREQWGKTGSIPQMARLFNVSETAMGIRIANLGLD